MAFRQPNEPGDGRFREPIAIIGLGCRFPGADSPEEFWQLLKSDRNPMTEIPADRFDVDAYYDSKPSTPGKVITRSGGFLKNIDQFDASFFGISPREAVRLDPQQRLLLEVALEAFEDAGLTAERLAASRAGVFVGLWANDYERSMFNACSDIDLYATTGGGRYAASGRISYAFDLRGPSMTVDTACSSSLVTVHLACNSLRNGESSVALAGGANLILQPQVTVGYSQGRMLSPDACCKFGDASADGYVRSEGVGLVVLKTLSRALADGDSIHALIRGSAVNNDGRSSNLLVAPSPKGQQEMLLQAYEDANISPSQIHYVEAHGTGTPVGDVVELEALGAVLSQGRPKDRPCQIGSVKTKIGHTEAASGVAGLLKAVFVLKNRMVPGNSYFRVPNPKISWSTLPVVMQRELAPLNVHSGPAFAAVNSFGITGTNAHVILEEAPSQFAGVTDRINDSGHDVPEVSKGHEAVPAIIAPRCFLLPLSAHSAQALQDRARDFKELLHHETSPVNLADICYTASRRITQREYRLAAAGHSRQEIAEQLDAFLRKEERLGLSSGRVNDDAHRKIAFVFCGQGPQWWAMGRELSERQGVFRETILQCDALLRNHADWSLLAELQATENASRLDQTEICQPVLFALQVALAAQWRSWGIRPDAAVGHSVGEVAAAHVAGILSLPEAIRVVFNRGRFMQRATGTGKMAEVDLPVDEARVLLIPYADRLSVAAVNSPKATVLSGEKEALEAVLTQLEQRGIICRPLPVNYAFHSHQMAPFESMLSGQLRDLSPEKNSVPMVSTVTGDLVSGEDLTGAYWGKNIRSTVRFAPAIECLARSGCNTFVEIGPHPVLARHISQTLAGNETPAVVVPSLRRQRPEALTLFGSLGALHVIGVPLDWNAISPSGGRAVSLPSYPWQRERFWINSENGPAKITRGPTTRNIAGTLVHPLLGIRLPNLASMPGSYFWQNKIDAGFRKVFRDYQNESSQVVPEAVYKDMAMAAAIEIFGEKLHKISEIVLHEPFSLSGDQSPELQFVLTSTDPAAVSFQIFGRYGEGTGEWRRFVSGRIEVSRVDSDWLYELNWKLKPNEKLHSGETTQPNRNWLILSDQQGLGSSLAELLESRGETCIVAFTGDRFQVKGPRRFCANPARSEDLKRLLAESLGADHSECRGVVYLWGLDAPATSELTLASLEESENLSCQRPLELIQALAKIERKSSPRVWLVTRAAQSVRSNDRSSLAVAQAALWGLGRVIALEHPELWGGLVDLPSLTNSAHMKMNEASELATEILGSDGEDQLAFREGQRYVLRLVRFREEMAKNKSIIIDADATYLITGGLGNLGLQVAAWLVAQGARNLVLTSRRGLQGRSEPSTIRPTTEAEGQFAAIRELEKQGAKISVVRADVADSSQMSQLWADIGRNHPPLRGIIHAAGVIPSVSDISQMRASDFHDALGAKVSGAWILHELAQAQQDTRGPLDFFVLFSTGASIWGSRGLAHYAAANHFLDALAVHRAGLKLPALTINWGWWAGDGIAPDSLSSFFSKVGLKSMPAEQALASLAFLLRVDATQGIVADIDWQIFKPIYEAKRLRPLLEQMNLKSQEAHKPAAELHSFVKQLQEAPPNERRQLLRNHVRNEVAKVLGFTSAQLIDPGMGFFKMGMDSIMTVQLQVQLEESLGSQLPRTLAFEYPTVEALTKFLAETVMKLAPPISTPVYGTDKKKSVKSANTREQLSEDELVDLLAKRLANIS